jgi:hypothetical protein
MDRRLADAVAAPWYGGMTVTITITITIAARTRPATCSRIARVS